MAIPTLYPDNDLAFKVKLKQLNLTSGDVEAMTAGTVNAFLSATKGGTQSGMLTTTLSSIGDGVWLGIFDASILPDSTIDPVFGTAAFAYLCLVFANGFKVWYTLPYVRYRDGIVK